MKVRLEADDYGHFDLIRVDTGESLYYTQTDWEYPGLAMEFGWQPCVCGMTDGTVSCGHRTASEMISDAQDYLTEKDGEEIDVDGELYGVVEVVQSAKYRSLDAPWEA